MFERDKDELRELGIPLETGTNSAGEDEVGYRISAAGLRAARDPAGAGRGGRPRAGRPGLAPGRAGRGGRGRAAQAAGGRDRGRGHHPAGHRAPAAHRGGGVRAAVGGGPGPAGGHVRLPRRRAAARPSSATWSRGAWSTATAGGTSSGLDTDRGEQRVFRLSRIDGPVTFTGAARRGHRAARHRRPGRRQGLGLRAGHRGGPARCGSGPGPGTGCAATRPGPRRPSQPAGTRSRSPTPTPAGGASTWPRSAPTWSCWSPLTCARRSSGG